MREKDRNRAGNGKFSEEDIRIIRASPESPRTLSILFGCGLETIRRIKRRDTWDWVQDAIPEHLIPKAAPADKWAAMMAAAEEAKAAVPGVKERLAAELQAEKERKAQSDKLLNELTGDVKNGSPDDKA